MKTKILLTQKEKALMSTGAVKRATRTRPSGALFGSVGVLLLLVAGVQGSGPASDAGEGAAAFECTNATIQGTYGIQIQGTRPVPPPLGGGTETVVGVVIRTYDGAGSFTQIDNVKGSVTGITPDRPGTGTYQVSSNCSAVTRVEPAPGIVIEERMVIVNGGGETRSVTTSPLTVNVTAVGKRIDADSSGASKLANISTRGFVQTGDDVIIGGTIVVGSSATRVIIRAIGPSLTNSGLPNVLQDPTLELHDSTGALVASNDNWQTDQGAEIMATGLAPTNDAESAIVYSLDPGGYTAIVRGKNGTTGVGLVEIYQLSE